MGFRNFVASLGAASTVVANIVTNGSSGGSYVQHQAMKQQASNMANAAAAQRGQAAQGKSKP
jgi:hypothetical protein